MTAAIRVCDLRFRYRNGAEILRGISLSVAEGECVGIVGPNGAGKSTLLLHLNGIFPDPPPKSPNVWVFGTPVARRHLFEVRRDVGLLFQEPDDQLFCPSVYEDVAFGPTQFGLPAAEVDSMVRTSLAQVGLAGFERRAPHRLSLGEKRRVCLAGVLACRPRVLVLDEPTSNLDPRGRRELSELLGSMPATQIIASHDLDMILALCSRVIVLDQGTVVAEGDAVEILSDEALMLAHGLEKPHSLHHLPSHATPPSHG